MSDGIEIRKLSARDVREVGPVFSRVLSNLGPEIKAFQAEDVSSEKKQEIGQRVMSYLLEHELENLWGWIAGLAGMGIDELDKAPIDTPAKILMQLKDDPGLRDFLSSVQAGQGS